MNVNKIIQEFEKWYTRTYNKTISKNKVNNYLISIFIMMTSYDFIDNAAKVSQSEYFRRIKELEKEILKYYGRD